MQKNQKNDYKQFVKDILKSNGNRVHKVTNSYGIYDGYKYYMKNRPKENKYRITESIYFAITRKINNILAENLILGQDISLPHTMGRLELRKYDAKISFKNNKLVTNLPVNWHRTLQLWHQDKDAHHKKILVRQEEKEIFKLYYNRQLADYNNKSFYEFRFNQALKKRLKNNIKEGMVDAFSFKH